MSDIVSELESEFNTPTPTPTLTEEEIEKCSEFLGIDISESEEFIVIHNNKDFTEAEALVLFPDELFHRNKLDLENEVHNSLLNKNHKYKYKIDTATSIPKSKITSIEIKKLTAPEGEMTSEPKQSDGYGISITCPFNEVEVFIFSDEHYAFHLFDLIRDWYYERDKFKK